MKTLLEIDKLISELFEERRNLLIDEGSFPLKYLVYDCMNSSINDELFVLDPNTDRDLKVLVEYTKGLEDIQLQMNMFEWLSAFTDYKCNIRGVCPIVGTPVCCAHCENNTQCLLEEENSRICGLVEVGDVVYIEDCEIII